jgi:RNA polymerase sigma-70 factor, ECF subfamily
MAAVDADREAVARAELDPVSRCWVQRLTAGHPGREPAVARLRELLVRVAAHELGRRRGRLGSISGPEFDDLAQQAADDAVLSILDKLHDFRGLSRFTTWAYKFAVFEVSSKVARHAWQRHPPSSDSPALEQTAELSARHPDQTLEQREQLKILSEAIGELTPRQREVFVAIALNNVDLDELALELGSTRNALYKNLFDARRRLRARLAEAGHPVTKTELSPS